MLESCLAAMKFCRRNKNPKGSIQLRVLGDLCQNDKSSVIETWILKTHLKSSVIKLDIL